MIKLFHHTVYPESIQYVADVLKSGWTGLGPKVEEFENALAEYLQTPFVIATNSGTSALEICLHCIQKNPKDYVITTPLTFISTVHSIVRNNMVPVFADIEPDTGNISVDSILKLLKSSMFIRERVKAILVVHYGGLPVDMDAVYEISSEYSIPIIEDAAHAFGAKYGDDRIGTKYSQYVAFSFHSVKPLAIGDGGAIATNSERVAQVAKQLRWCGIDKSTHERTSGGTYSWDYSVKSIGLKAYMNSIQAAIGLGQLQHAEDDARLRQRFVDIYRERLSTCNGISLLATREHRTSSNHLFVILCNNPDDKPKLMAFLQENGIQTGCHYRPAHTYPMYRAAISDDGCKNSIDFFTRAISLPMHVSLSEQDITDICDKIHKFFGGELC